MSKEEIDCMPPKKFNCITPMNVNCAPQKELKIHPSAHAERRKWRRMIQEYEQATVQADRAAKRERAAGFECDITGAGAGIIVEE
jgi:hypothetical protein